MLQKNVYILYPAGYFGTYVNWALNISDIDLAKETVLNPINNSSSDQLGGPGTSHLHKKIPTHQGPMSHFMWVMYNKPTHPKIYNLNQGNDTLPEIDRTITTLFNSDPDPVFIVIHDNNDKDILHFGAINAMIKWPTQFSIRRSYGQFNKVKEFYEVDPFNCSNDIKFRNLVVEHGELLFRGNSPLNYQRLQKVFDTEDHWYKTRNSLQPHEVNEETYINPQQYLKDKKYQNRIFELSCLDVVTMKFPEILKNILSVSELSTQYSTEYVEEFHHNFINAQKNLEWFPSISHWRLTRELNDFLKSHSIMQGIVIKEMLDKNNKLLELDWKSMSIEDINLVFIKSN